MSPMMMAEAMVQRTTLVEIEFEYQLAAARTMTQPSRCPRCQGLVVNDDEARVLWRCVNCGCRGEGFYVYGSIVGFEPDDKTRSRGPFIPQSLMKGRDNDEDDDYEISSAAAEA